MRRAEPSLGQAGAHRARRRRVRVIGVGAGRAFEHVGHALQPRHLVLRRQLRIVGDVVADAREPVERVDMGPQVAPDQPRADREILVLPALARRGLDRGHASPLA